MQILIACVVLGTVFSYCIWLVVHFTRIWDKRLEEMEGFRFPGTTMDKTIYSEFFCPQCRKYSGKVFTIITEGKSPPNPELLKCQCGWVGSWMDCIERTER